jgi:NAD(P)-dependent dehydrogenase (short-subunit alcohol dehydrogenase family)
MSRALAGKVAIVTGGASGIGRALSEELAARGCEVVVADRQMDLAREVAAKIHDRGGSAIAVELDVRDLEAFERVARDTVARSRTVDFLFNNAGIGVGGEMASYDPEDWDDVIDVNLRGVAHGIQAVYPIMIGQRSGHIVNTASVAGLIAPPHNGSYTATKHAVVALTKSLRMEAVRHGVRASVLCPGVIRTPILTGGRFGRTKLEGATESLILKQWERARPMTPDVFARKAVDRVLANQAIVVVPGWYKAFWYLERLSPDLSMALWRRILDRTRAELEASGVTFQGRKKAKPSSTRAAHLS